MRMVRSLDVPIRSTVDTSSGPPLYCRETLEQCKTSTEDSTESGWVEHQTQDDISFMSEDPTVSTEIPNDERNNGELVPVSDQTSNIPDESIEPKCTDPTNSAVPAILSEPDDKVIAPCPVRGRPKSSKLGCADAPMCWYSPALEPITEYSENSVPTDSIPPLTTGTNITTVTNNRNGSSKHNAECTQIANADLMQKFRSLENAVDEVETNQAWVATQLSQFRQTLTMTSPLDDAATVRNRLEQIDQLLETLALLGARLRNLEQHVKQAWSDLPV
ncbi:unnamed protein product, partial [Echinostoma caproni]|uniref:Biogenesis of lysosome-related organelles complex 1 subunit 7 n=1 Tax=Echinostoma caproni TaxID=27848 RepID=A0A183A457_9TREM